MNARCCLSLMLLLSLFLIYFIFFLHSFASRSSRCLGFLILVILCVILYVLNMSQPFFYSSSLSLGLPFSISYFAWCVWFSTNYNFCWYGKYTFRASIFIWELLTLLLVYILPALSTRKLCLCAVCICFYFCFFCWLSVNVLFFNRIWIRWKNNNNINGSKLDFGMCLKIKMSSHPHHTLHIIHIHKYTLKLYNESL